MGRNVDLCWMLGAPIMVGCPECGRLFNTHFDDYDIDNGKCNPSPGKWNLRAYCPHCGEEGKETEIDFDCTVVLIKDSTDKPPLAEWFKDLPCYRNNHILHACAVAGRSIEAALYELALYTEELVRKFEEHVRAEAPPVVISLEESDGTRD